MPVCYICVCATRTKGNDDFAVVRTLAYNPKRCGLNYSSCAAVALMQKGQITEVSVSAPSLGGFS